jgi:TolB protein
MAAAPSTAATPGTGPAQSAQPATPVKPGPAPLPGGQVGTLAQVPWAQVGPGWALAEYTAGSNQAAAPVTLYMLDPEGGMYRVYRWPATTQPWPLIDWSGDKSRVLLEQPGTSLLTVHELTITTGQVTTFTLPSAVTSVLGYTRPDGDNILVAQNGIARYTRAGLFQARLSQGGPNDSVVSSLNGLTEIVTGGAGVEVVSNAGGVVRSLPVPGSDASEGGCRPVRWWNAADVLVTCMPYPGPTMVSAARLWLVPVGGAAPTALTPERPVGSPDYGDVDAWQLSTGLYLQAEASCGPPFIARELSGNALAAVSSASVVIATSGDRMLVQQYTECVNRSSLVWLNPATSNALRVLAALPNSTGVVAAIAFDGDGEQPS